MTRLLVSRLARWTPPIRIPRPLRMPYARSNSCAAWGGSLKHVLCGKEYQKQVCNAIIRDLYPFDWNVFLRWRLV